mgnify:CR=1 FL=1
MGKKKTTEEFIKEATEKHRGKYDYHKVDYVNSATKVCIICHEHGHGEFWQRPTDHLSGYGCPRCGKEANRLSKEDFIKKAKKIHGDKYDYSKVEYVNCMTKVCIICPEHGEFWQNPNSHLQGHGCSKCKCDKLREEKTSSKEEFIKKAREKHGDKYDYTKVDYVNSNTKVCVKCPEHGEFWQIPADHTQGHGCPKCGGKYSPTKEEWIALANEVHNGKYDYSKVDYVNNKTKVCIICPEHGEFWQEAKSHINGNGCPNCSYEANGERCRSSKEEFIKKAREKHGDKYDYSKVEYVNCETKVCIICPEHGEFWQRPNNHLQGAGCPKCNLSHLERDVMNYLDDAGINYDYQKRFNWLGKQSLDFYLPDYNVGIECQGGQHFFPVEHFGGDKGFKKTLKRDKRKKALCEKHDIKLLYYSNLGIEYPYDVFEDLDLLFKEIKN